MKQINSTICIGSAGSEMRYRNATTICADCLEQSKRLFPIMPYQALMIGNKPMISQGVCYVCEITTFISFVRFSLDKSQ